MQLVKALKVIVFLSSSFGSFLPLDSSPTQTNQMWSLRRILGDTPPLRSYVEAGNTHSRRMEADYFDEAVANAEDQLDVIFETLKMFMSAEGFDRVFFQRYEPILNRQISEVSNWIVENQPQKQVILKQLAYARRIFRVMIQAAEGLAFFTTTDRGSRLVRTLIKLNIRLLVLHDAMGVPDPRSPDFQLIVSRLASRMITCENSFKKLVNPSPAVQFMFSDQLARAKRTLHVLSTYATKQEQ